MSSGDGPPPIFDGTDFSYWKIRMEAYLDAMDAGVLRAAVVGFDPPKDANKLTADEANHEKWNAKARNILMRGLTKDVFNSVRSAVNAHEIWTKLVEMQVGSKDEREERFKVVMDRINAFKMLPHENANQMYSRFNVLVEELHDLDISKLEKIDIIRRILAILPKEKYSNIVTYFHQKKLDKLTITQVLGKIHGHEMYMGIANDEGATSSKKNDIALKATKEKKNKSIKVDSSDDDESDDDMDVALLVRKTSKLLRKLDKKGVNFDEKKKKFYTTKKSIKDMDCFNCGKLGHLAHQCPLPDKRKKNKSKEDDSDDESEKKHKKHSHKSKKYDKKKKPFNKKKKEGRAYIGEWITDDESSEASSSSSDSEKEGVAGLAITTSTPPPPSLFSSPNKHICLMARGGHKVSKDTQPSSDQDDSDSDSDNDSDHDYELPSYDELATLLKKYTKIIMKANAKVDTLKDEKNDLVDKCSEHETRYAKLKEKHDEMKGTHSELDTRYEKLKKDFQELSSSYKNLEITFDALSNEKYDAPKVVKVDCSTSCDDLVDPPMKPSYCSSCKAKNVDDGSSKVDSSSEINELRKENEVAKNEIKTLKQQVNDLKTGYKRLANGEDKFGEMLSNKAINYNQNGLGFSSSKRVQAPKTRPHSPKRRYCTECQQEGHFAFDCKTPPQPKKQGHLKQMAFNAYYGLSRTSNGKVVARFFGPKDKSRPKQIWVPKSLIASSHDPHSASTSTAQASIKVWAPKPQA